MREYWMEFEKNSWETSGNYQLHQLAHTDMQWSWVAPNEIGISTDANQWLASLKTIEEVPRCPPA